MTRPTYHFRLILVPLLLAGLALLGNKATRAVGQERSGQQPPRPAQTALSKADDLIMKLYRAEYQAAKTDAAAARALAAVLLKEAKATTDDSDLQFAAFVQASELAVQGGNVTLALSAVGELAKRFAVDSAAMKRAVLTSAPDKITTPAAALELVHAVLAHLNDMMADDSYEGLAAVVAAAEKVVPLVADGRLQLAAQIKKEAETVQAAQKEFTRMKPFLDKLEENKDDAEANLEMGKYLAFGKGNFARGLPFLAKGNDATLKALASNDLALAKVAGTSKDPKDLAELKIVKKQIELADAWAKLAEEGKDPRPKSGMLRRAYHWYMEALPQLDGLTRVRIQHQVHELAKQFGQGITTSLGMKLTLIPAGAFLMGSPQAEPGRGFDEGPQHEVRISRPFYMGIHEVTVGNYRAFVEASGYRTDPERSGNNQTWKNPGWNADDDHPVVCVSWNDAVAFCKWLSAKEGKKYRLPTEAEWEYACRAGTKTATYFGDSLSSTQANFDGNQPYNANPGPYLRRGTKVGSYASNAFGLHDMHGSAWEWCQDFYQANYYKDSPRDDPQGPASGTSHPIRGGGWFRSGQDCRAAKREAYPPTSIWNNTGFRVVCDISGKAAP